jgi:hypothetical protein
MWHLLGTSPNRRTERLLKVQRSRRLRQLHPVPRRTSTVRDLGARWLMMAQMPDVADNPDQSLCGLGRMHNELQLGDAAAKRVKVCGRAAMRSRMLVSSDVVKRGSEMVNAISTMLSAC